MRNDSTAVFIGRFQPFHLGHYFRIEDFSEKYSKFVIAIGSPEKSRTEKNPLNIEERKEILENCFPHLRKVPVKDEDRGKEGFPDWADRLVENTGADVVITGNDRVKEIIRTHSEASVDELDLYCPEKFSGTKIRKRIRNKEDWKNLVPECSKEKITEYTDIIRKTG